MATAVALVVAVGPGIGVPTPSTLSQATPTVRRHGMLSVGRAAAKHRSGAGACGDPWDATADAASTSGIPRGNIDWEVSERHTHVHDDARHSLMSGGLIVVGFLAAVLGVCLRSHWHDAAPIAVMSASGKRSGNGRRWEKVKRALETYQSWRGDLYVRRDFVVPVHPDWPEDLWGMKLGVTVHSLRNKGTYSTHRAELEEMGFDFDPQRTTHGWENVKCALETYQLLHDDLSVRYDFVVPAHPDWPEDLWGMKLGVTVNNIRNNGTYSAYRAELEEMGFDFDPQRTSHGWENVKCALETYQLLHDDLYVRHEFSVPVHPDWPEDLWGMKLGVTVNNIRNQGTYSTYRAELEEMGFDFDPQRIVHGWENVKRALLAYKSLCRDLLVPVSFVIPKDADWPEDLWGMKLGLTVYSIRNQGTYSTHRAELEEMGFDFDPQRIVHGWENVKRALLAYKSLCRDLLVPVSFVIPKDADWPEDLWGMKLGLTVYSIRNKGAYSAYRDELEQMGFDFDVQSTCHGWENVKLALLKYKSLRGDLLVPVSFVIPENADWPEDLWCMKLGLTVSSIRNQGAYSTYRDELEEMGFDFDSQSTAHGWENVKRALLKYKSLRGDLLVRQDFVIPENADWPEDLWGMKPGLTVSSIRNKGAYSTHRAELEEMGFDFDPQSTAHGWENVKRALLAYKSLCRDLLVCQSFVIPKDADWPEDLWGMKLGLTVNNIRNNGAYSTYRAELEEMGFDFDPQRTAHGWENVKLALLKYKSLHGDLLVPVSFVIPKDGYWPEDLWCMKLGLTVYSIRNQGAYSTYRAELEEMGFDFDSQSTGHGWENVKRALLKYKSLHGDLLVRQDFVIPEDGYWPEDLWCMKLGLTVYSIRNQGAYSTYRAELEEMGFDFDSQSTGHGWENVKRALLKYKSLHGDLVVHTGFVIPEDAYWPEDLWGMNLGRTVYSIRKRGTYSAYRDELEQMDFSFESQLGLFGDAAILGFDPGF